MTYIVLARKWRPMKFEEVIGQTHVTRTIMNALKQNRVAHAYIFAGPRGVGKTTTARLLAKAVNCEKQPAVNPCNECGICLSITKGNSMDVIEIDGASNRGIDEIRNLRENIRFAPASAKFKIYIIDEVHMLTKEAFNALLKTLEEPPAHAIFIFATTEIHKVPLTILSRCQRFDFKRIASSEIAAHLGEIARNEKIDIDENSLHLIARKSEGSMRDAQSIMDQLISYTDSRITAEQVRDSLGLINEELYFEFTDLIAEANDAKIIGFAQQVFQSGHDLMDFVYGLEEHFRNLLVTRATGHTKLLETSDDFKNLYAQQASAFQETDLLHYIEILTQSENLLKFSPNPQLILEFLLLKLAHKPAVVDIQTLLSSFEPPSSSGGENLPSPSVKSKPAPPSGSNTAEAPRIKENSENKYPPPPPPQPVNPASGNGWNVLNTINMPSNKKAAPVLPAEKRTTNFSEIQSRWDEIVDFIKSQKIALGHFLRDTVPYKMDNGCLQIAFDFKSSFHMEHVKNQIREVEKILEGDFNLPARLQCVSINFQEHGIQKKIHSPREVIEDIKEKEPVLRKIIELFDCENIDEQDINLM